jgi:hypothetical protein
MSDSLLISSYDRLRKTKTSKKTNYIFLFAKVNQDK